MLLHLILWVMLHFVCMTAVHLWVYILPLHAGISSGEKWTESIFVCDTCTPVY